MSSTLLLHHFPPMTLTLLFPSGDFSLFLDSCIFSFPTLLSTPVPGKVRLVSTRRFRSCLCVYIVSSLFFFESQRQTPYMPSFTTFSWVFLSVTPPRTFRNTWYHSLLIKKNIRFFAKCFLPDGQFIRTLYDFSCRGTYHVMYISEIF